MLYTKSLWILFNNITISHFVIDSHEVVKKCIKKNEALHINIVSKNPEKSTKKEFKRFARYYLFHILTLPRSTLQKPKTFSILAKTHSRDHFWISILSLRVVWRAQ